MSSKGPGVGAIAVVAEANKVLLIKRSKAPNKGTWAFPGGSIEWGEPVRDAALRELSEETGLSATPVRWLDPYDATGEGFHFVLLPLYCVNPNGTLAAADDAEEARWVTLAELQALDTSPGVEDYARQVIGGA